MREQIVVNNLGLISYADALKIQEARFNQLLTEKRGGSASTSAMQLILCQHRPVFTLGKSGDENNLLPLAKSSDAEYYRTSRGGDITYHGPGQLVGYPIFDLERLGIGLAKYIELIEESIIRTIAEYGIVGERLPGEAGVWLDINTLGRTRKICAIGVKASRWVTMHGFAFNVNTDLHYFDMINPCGFTDKGVTSLNKELGMAVDFDGVSKRFMEAFEQVFEVQLIAAEKVIP